MAFPDLDLSRAIVGGTVALVEFALGYAVACACRSGHDLTGEERRLLVNLLTVEIERDRYPPSSRIEALKRVRAKLRGDAPPALPAAPRVDHRPSGGCPPQAMTG